MTGRVENRDLTLKDFHVLDNYFCFPLWVTWPIWLSIWRRKHKQRSLHRQRLAGLCGIARWRWYHYALNWLYFWLIHFLLNRLWYYSVGWPMNTLLGVTQAVFYASKKSVPNRCDKTMNIWTQGKTGPDDHLIIVIESQYGECHIYVQFSATVYLKPKEHIVSCCLLISRPCFRK